MKTRSSIYCLSILILFSANLKAQDYANDIRQALLVYGNSKLQLDTKIQVFANYSATEPSQVYKASVKKDGANFYSDAGDVKMLMNEKYLVMVYNTDKHIVYSEHDKQDEKSFINRNTPSSAIDSMLAKNDSVVYKGISGQMKLYVIYTGKSIIRRSEVYLDSKAMYVKRLVYYYNEQYVPQANKVIIDYTINTSPVFSPNEFSESRFVILKRGKAIAASEFAGYDVIFVDSETGTPEEK